MSDMTVDPWKVAGDSMTAPVEVGQLWQRIGGKQKVRIHRVWTICGCGRVTMHAYDPKHGAEKVVTLRAMPTHGGTFWAIASDFFERFELSEAEA